MHLDKRLNKLEQRFRILTEERIAAMEALELAGNVAHFDTSFNQLDSPIPILQETAFKCGTLLRFAGAGFYLVEEDNSDFILRYAAPDDFSLHLEREVELLIEQGAFAWALERNRPLFFQGATMGGDFLVHALATPSRVRGMFIGLLACKRQEVGDIALSLLSIVLHSCAHMLESHALYGLLRAHCCLEKCARDETEDPVSRSSLLQTLQLTRFRLQEAEIAQSVGRELLNNMFEDLPLQNAAEKILVAGQKLTNSQEGLVGLYEADTSALRCLALTGRLCQQWERFSDGHGGRTFRLPGVEDSLPVWALAPRMANAPMNNVKQGGFITRYLCCPIIEPGGTRRGCLALCNAPQDYLEQDLAAVSRLAALFAGRLRNGT